jgi:hypothetical protein
MNVHVFFSAWVWQIHLPNTTSKFHSLLVQRYSGSLFTHDTVTLDVSPPFKPSLTVFCTNLQQVCLFNSCTAAVTCLSVFHRQRYTQANQSHFIKQCSHFVYVLTVRLLPWFSSPHLVNSTYHNFRKRRFTNCGTMCYMMLGKVYLLLICLQKCHWYKI